MLATVCWEEAACSRNHGSWGWKRPIWSWSLFLCRTLITPLGNSGALCKNLFPNDSGWESSSHSLGNETALSVEEILSSRLVGIFCWLAPAPSLLASLSQTTLNKPPSTSCLPTVKSVSCFRWAAIKQRSRGLLPTLGAFWRADFPQLLQYSGPLVWTSL